jgi:hypothetical protein
VRAIHTLGPVMVTRASSFAQVDATALDPEVQRREGPVEIDAVFVTVGPNGESAKPSGKPLLFTYLRMTPNHP